jgi:hypothetical protein
MYVTDVPVIDRLTDPAVREIDAAMALFEDMTADLYGAADDAASVAQEALECDDVECDQYHAKDLEKALGRLSDHVELALAAQHSIRQALDLAGLPTL